ncbi:MAG: PspC domain-containing protein [Proteobacteria bacterium]|jgi:phage shock protein PspC (stress-responsive transcriptional regulator)|nr:PspC domain-containing protein [Pseudomonadota bacterium]
MRGWRLEKGLRLHRPSEGRVLAGVCAALAQYLKLDVNFIRLAFLVLSLASGLGIIVYLLLWILSPERVDGGVLGETWTEATHANAQNVARDVSDAVENLTSVWYEGHDVNWPRAPSRWAGVGLVAGGGLVVLYSLGLFSWLGTTGTLGIAIIAVGASILVSRPPEEES